MNIRDKCYKPRMVMRTRTDYYYDDDDYDVNSFQIMDTRYKPGMVILAGNSHPGLAEEVARHLGTAPGSCLVYHNTNREPEYIAGLQSRILSNK